MSNLVDWFELFSGRFRQFGIGVDSADVELVGDVETAEEARDPHAIVWPAASTYSLLRG